MTTEGELPVLTDLIEKGDEIKMSDLGLVEDTLVEDDSDSLRAEIAELTSDVDPFLKAALEQSIRRILDEHMELAMQEIRLVIERELNKPR
jgi:hypothetical protein